ncbi:MAG: hypothetical protein H6745_31390 [Deltaproteobacteria bacterium]|nr:hypothetical protein [Deltaproteobacteria bacterium]
MATRSSGERSITARGAGRGTWSQPTPDALVFSYTDPETTCSAFSGRRRRDCFEGLTTFIPGPYVSPYEVCK